MKRYGKLFERITSPKNIEYAYMRARQGKGWQRKVAVIDARKDAALAELREMLISGRYHTSAYREKVIYEPKQRTIYILPFYPDRIAQHAIMAVIAPLWDKMMIADSFACRVGKGQHAGSSRCMEFVRRNKWCLQCDISKFYPSIDHKILMGIIERKIKDRRTLALLEEIISSTGTETNVPIGNYTSQWFGNLYMNELDQLLKHRYHVRDYVRYCDDFLLFDNDKERLNALAATVKDYATEHLRLTLSKCNLFPTAQGVDFLGYRHFPDGKILVRKRTAKRLKRRLKRLPYEMRHGLISADSARSTVASVCGWLKHAQTYNFRRAVNLDGLQKMVEGYAQVR